MAATTLAAATSHGASLGLGKARWEDTYRTHGLQFDSSGREASNSSKREARKKWDGLLARQSRTFQQAVDEYERRYQRKPPRGFDQWYAWARKHDVQLIDEYNLIEHGMVRKQILKCRLILA